MPRPRSCVWPAADAKLRDRWLAGVNCVAIGRELGVSADACIGRAHRLGLPRHPAAGFAGNKRSHGPKDAATKRRHHQRIGPPPAPRVTLPALGPPVPPEPPPLVDPACAYPIGEPRTPGFRWCTTAAQANSPYCREHHAVCYLRYPVRHDLAAAD